MAVYILSRSLPVAGLISQPLPTGRGTDFDFDCGLLDAAMYFVPEICFMQAFSASPYRGRGAVLKSAPLNTVRGTDLKGGVLRCALIWSSYKSHFFQCAFAYSPAVVRAMRL